MLAVHLFEMGPRAGAQFLGHIIVETFDPGQFLDRHESDLLEGGEALGDQ